MSASRRLSVVCGVALVATALIGSPLLSGPASAAVATPTVTSTTPASPAQTRTPLVKGTAESGSTVTLYSNSSCSSSALGSGSASSFGGSGVTATVPANATTRIYARATRSGQTASGCSSTSVSYTNDSAAPALVTLSSVTPASPSPSRTPVVKGAAEAGSTVRLYSTAGCTGSPLVTGTAAAFASPGFTASVVVGTTTTFRATATDAAGNSSACSTSSVTFKSDLPDGGFEAATGSPAVSPYWTEMDSLAGSPLCTVTTCTPGDQVAPHSGNAWAWFGGFPDADHVGSVSQVLTIPVGTASVSYWYRNSNVSAPYDAQLLVKIDGTTVQTHTEASADEAAYTKQVADVSAFANGASHTLLFSYSNGGAGINNMLVDDVGLSAVAATHTAAPTVVATAPASPSGSTTPLVTGTSGAGTTVTLYADAACSGLPLGTGTAAAFGSTGITATVSTGVTTTIHARATKAGQDDSPCSTTSASYTQRFPQPETTLTRTPKKKVSMRKDRRSASVVFAFTSPMSGATFECSLDGKAFTACVSGRKVKVKHGKHTFAVRAVASGVSDPTPATYAFKVRHKKPRG